MAEPPGFRVAAAIVTRARVQAGPLCRGLEEMGIRAIASPAIRFDEPGDWGPFDGAAAEGGSWDWLILTSANGVRAVSRRLTRLGSGWQAFAGARVAAIGPATARALREAGVEPSLVPEEFVAEGILEAFEGEPLESARILLARAEKARDVLPDELRRRGAQVDVVPVYRTVPCEPSAEAVQALRGAAGRDLLVIFTSPSTVEHFLARLPEDAAAGVVRATIASIGPITSAALRARGLQAAIQPSEYTVPALLESIQRRLSPA